MEIPMAKKYSIRKVLILFIAVSFLSCTSAKKKESPLVTGHYTLIPVDLRDVKLTDEFWLPIIRRIQEKTIPYALKKCEEEGRLDNFLIAGGQMEGDVTWE